MAGRTRIDIAIYNDYRRRIVDGADFLLRTDIHLITRSDHRLSQNRDVALRSLADVPLALPARLNSLTSVLVGLAAAHSVELAIRIEANSTTLIGEAISLLLYATAAGAQTDTPRAIKTQRVSPHSTAPIYQVALDGSARIAWKAVEAAAPGADPSTSGVAAVLLAVRNGRWMAMSRESQQ